MLNRRRAAITIVLAYMASAAIAAYFIFYLSQRQGAGGDGRAETMALCFGAVVAVLCVRAVFLVYRRPKRLEL